MNCQRYIVEKTSYHEAATIPMIYLCLDCIPYVGLFILSVYNRYIYTLWSIYHKLKREIVLMFTNLAIINQS